MVSLDRLLPCWLTNALAEYRLDCYVLGKPAITLSEYFDEEIDPFQSESLKSGVFHAINAGLVELVDENGRVISMSESSFSELVQNGPQQTVFLGYTSRGAQQWEEWADPKWSKYILFMTEHNCSPIDLDAESTQVRGEIEGVSRSTVLEFYECVRYLGVFPEFGTEQCIEIVPWEATYWKMFPIGWRVTFEAEERPAPLRSEIPEWFRDLRRWHE